MDIVVGPNIGRQRADTQADDAKASRAFGQGDHGQPHTTIGSKIGGWPGCADRVEELQSMQGLAVVERQKMHIRVGLQPLRQAQDPVEVARHEHPFLRKSMGLYEQPGSENHHPDAERRTSQPARSGRVPGNRIPRPSDQQQQAAAKQAPRQLSIGFEHQRRNHSHEQSAKRPARGDQQIERREALRLGSEPVQLAMTDHTADEERAGINRQDQEQGNIALLRQHPADRAQEQNQRQREGEAPIPARAVKADDETHQVDRQRRHPQKGNHCHVLAHFVRGRQQQRGGASREQKPEEVVES